MEYAEKITKVYKRSINKILDIVLVDDNRVSVFDGEEWQVRHTNDRQAIIEAVLSVDWSGIEVNTINADYICRVQIMLDHDPEILSDIGYNNSPESLAMVAKLESIEF